MKCFRCFSFALFALLGVFFGSFIINQNNTYAVDDITYIIDSSNYSTQSVVLCSNFVSSYPDCLKYIYITQTPSCSTFTTSSPNFDNSLQFNLAVQAQAGGYSTSLDFYYNRMDSLFTYIDTIGHFTYYRYTGSSFPADCEFTITLSENNPFSGSQPSGSIELTENGTYDVTNYAEAVVNVPETDCPPSSGGDYHNDLVAINNSIMICAATCLVIYFFYCIYRMIIKNSGVK